MFAEIETPTGKFRRYYFNALSRWDVDPNLEMATFWRKLRGRLANPARRCAHLAVVGGGRRDDGATIDGGNFRLDYATDPAGTGGGVRHVAPSGLQIAVGNPKITDDFSASVAGGIRKFNDLEVGLLSGNTIRNNLP